MKTETPGAPRVTIGWSSFSVSPSEAGEGVAAQLLALASDPRSWSLSNFGATVTRRRMDGHDEFYFSPRAAQVFEALIQMHGGASCDPPRARDLDHNRTSRMLLGFKTWWDRFEPRVRTRRKAKRSRPLPGQSPRAL